MFELRLAIPSLSRSPPIIWFETPTQVHKQNVLGLIFTLATRESRNEMEVQVFPFDNIMKSQIKQCKSYDASNPLPPNGV